MAAREGFPKRSNGPSHEERERKVRASRRDLTPCDARLVLSDVWSAYRKEPHIACGGRQATMFRCSPAVICFTVVASPPAWGETQARPVSFGVEVAFRSGHADRGFIINDRPVIQPETWVSGAGAEFSVWSSLPLAQTTDGARPQILELELTREHHWGRLTVAPALRSYFYHEALNAERDRSLEGWLTVSLDVGPFALFTRQSLDMLSYKGAYFVDAGITSARRVSGRLELGGSLGAGWASARFNDAYAGVAQRALDRV